MCISISLAKARLIYLGGDMMHEKYIKAIKEGNTHYFYTSRIWRNKRILILERDNF